MLVYCTYEHRVNALCILCVCVCVSTTVDCDRGHVKHWSLTVYITANSYAVAVDTLQRGAVRSEEWAVGCALHSGSQQHVSQEC